MEPNGRGAAGTDAISLTARLAELPRHWAPSTVATVNDYEVRLARVRGEFVRHQHPDTDEFFLVLSGELILQLDDEPVVLQPGDLYVVPAGAYHRPVAHVETSVLLFERSSQVDRGHEHRMLAGRRTMH